MRAGRFWYAVFFVAAVVALSRTIAAGNGFLAEPGATNALKALGWIAALVCVVTMLAFQMYRQEKARGNVKVPVTLFERMLRKRGAGRRKGSES